MPTRPKKPCPHPGCNKLTDGGRCDEHKKKEQKYQDSVRGSAHERGYTYRWSKYSKWFLRQPGNQICKLRLDKGCTLVANCVDHIKPVEPSDPLFYDPSNHQASCIHCNSVKGRREIQGSEWRV